MKPDNRLSLIERIEKLERQLADIQAFAQDGYRQHADKLEPKATEHSAQLKDFEERLSTCQFGGGTPRRHLCPFYSCIFGAQKYLGLSERQVILDYRMLYSNYAESDSTENEIRSFELMIQHAPEGPFLNWGAGGGWSNTISTLRGLGFDVWRYEPSLDQSTQFVVKHQKEISAKFGGTFSNNVIEHFRKPIEEFKYFQSLLKSDGLMTHQSPCYRYEYANTRFHTLFLLGDSPKVLAAATGFEADRVRDDSNTISWLYRKK